MRTMNPERVIHWFDDFDGPNDFAFLSNFYVGEPLVDEPYAYQTGEHMFQAYKMRTRKLHERVASTPDPGEAKRLGKSLPLRADWENVKYDVMRWVLAQKFTLTREEGALLLSTGDALLVEGTFWSDRVWGVDLRRPPAESSGQLLHEAPGRNWLGVLLMARRAELRAEVELGVRFNYGDTTTFARYGRLVN